MHYETYHTSDKSLHKLLLDAVPEIYLDVIKHDTLGFGRCTSLDILEHLCDTYNIINDDQLAANLEMIKTPLAAPHQETLHPAEDVPSLLDFRK